MSEALEQKFADALDGHRRLIALEEGLIPKDIYIKKGDDPFVDLVNAAHSGVTGVVSVNTLFVRHNGQLYETKPTKRGLLIELSRYCTEGPSSIDSVDLVQRVTRLVGDESSLQVGIGDSRSATGRHLDIGVFVSIDNIRDKPVREATAVIFPAHNHIMRYELKRYGVEGPALSVYAEGNYDPKFIELLRQNAKKTIRDGAGRFVFELNGPLQSVAYFVALVEESAQALKTGVSMVTSLDFQAPLKDLKILQRPPYFELKHEDGVQLDYRYELTPYSALGRKNSEHLRLMAPVTQLAKAAEFFDGIKIEARW